MDKYTTSIPRLLSFDQVYINTIKPKLEAIDLFLKENTTPFHVYEVANILEIEIHELETIMENLKISELDFATFFSIVFNASSEICKLICRQQHYANMNTYTPEMIAEIYKLNIHKVQLAFADLDRSQINDKELIHVFKRVHCTVF